MTDDSKCSKGLYCQFDVVLSNQEVQVERCRNCGKKVVYNKDTKGNVDNFKYKRDHLRDTLQPFGPTKEMFKKTYGSPSRIFSKKTKEEMKSEWEEMRKEMRKPKKTYFI